VNSVYSGDMMRWITIESTDIKRISFKNNELFVELKSGNKYKYLNVQRNIFDSLVETELKGKFFQETIKGCFEYEKMELK
jgi:hypothetical protein